MARVLILSPQADEMIQLSAWLLGSVSEEILERSVSKHTYPVFDVNVSCVLGSQWFYVVTLTFRTVWCLVPRRSPLEVMSSP